MIEAYKVRKVINNRWSIEKIVYESDVVDYDGDTVTREEENPNPIISHLKEVFSTVFVRRTQYV